MIEINLLPWRKMKAKQDKIKYFILFLFFIILIFLYHFVSHLFAKNNIPKPQPNIMVYTPKEHSALKKLKYVGYIHEQNKIWGIITLAQDAAQDIQVGKSIPNDDLRVMSIDKNKIVFLDSAKKHYVVHKSPS